MLLQRATFGLARAHEAIGQGRWPKPARNIARSPSKWPDSPYAAPAEARAKDLDRPATKTFYDWFAKYEPPRPMAKEPGTPGVRPDFMKDPLDDGGLKLPSAASTTSRRSPELRRDPATDEKPAEPDEAGRRDTPAECRAEPRTAIARRRTADRRSEPAPQP